MTSILVALCFWLAPSQAQVAPPPDVDAAVATLRDFDAGWAANDVAAMMQPIAGDFGCELFGQVGVADLEATLRQLRDDLGESRSVTHVLGTHVDGPIVSIFVRRELRRLDPTDGAGEILDLVFHMRAAESGAMAIVGMEELDVAALERMRGDTYVGAAGSLRLPLPAGWLAVPSPPSGPCIEHLRLRRDGLSTELDIMLVNECTPIDLARALETDLDAFLRRTPLGKVETIEPVTIAGLPARRAKARYDGAGCGLAGKNAEAGTRPRRLDRIYVLVDSTLLLAFDLRADARDSREREREFERMLAALTIDLPADEGLAARLARNRFGSAAACGRFDRPDIGFAIDVGSAYRMLPVATNAVFTLHVTRSAGAGPDVRIDAIRVLDPSQDLESFVAADGVAFDERMKRLGRLASPARVDEVAASPRTLRAVRQASQTGPAETALYLRREGVLFTLRWNGSSADADDADRMLRALLDGIVLVP
ncbi:MAG: hypothetical protein IPH13_06640 [Planctomycetes bacterium]|nr:hypothetical protein [Planctomycetota bacterium]MCC7172085.1 hypothetical protein [Planctomycetota bacterium]